MSSAKRRRAAATRKSGTKPKPLSACEKALGSADVFRYILGFAPTRELLIGAGVSQRWREFCRKPELFARLDLRFLQPANFGKLTDILALGPRTGVVSL